MKQVKKILLLEDDFESMSDLKIHLEEEKGWQVDLSADAGMMDRLAVTKYDLILLDLMINPMGLNQDGLPVQNIQFPNVRWQFTGLEFLKRLRSGQFSQSVESTPATVRVVVLSAVANDTAASEAELEGLADRYVEKPFRLSTLVKIIEDLLLEEG
jgi:CheY-like chemotaxis protein